MTRSRGVASGLVGLCLLLVAGPAHPADRPSVIITDPSARSYRTAVQQFALQSSGLAREPEVLREALVGGLEFSSLFISIGPEAFLGPTVTPPHGVGDRPICPNWRQIGADVLVQGALRRETSEIAVEFRVWDVHRGCLSLLHKRYRVAADQMTRLGKSIADDVVGALTGKPGVASTEIAFVSDRSKNREVYVMDADGGRARRATTHRSITGFPSWNAKGDAIAYTSYLHRQRPHIFVLTRGGRSPGRILRNLNNGAPRYRAVFDPTGQRFALVMSADGATEIYTVGRKGRNLRRLTRNKVIDVSPTWSPDGRRIVFVSDRSGSPQVYVMDDDGGNTRRVTFDGSYNTAPAWSPDGRWIAYETRVGGQFDIWITDPEGRQSGPLITHPRSDEHPSWSPDGRKLVFTSSRRGRKDIYVVDMDGSHVRRLTRGAGDNLAPAWGPYRR